MHRFKTALLATLLCCTLSACGSTPEPHVEGLTPLHFTPVDPDDTVLRSAVHKFLKKSEAPVSSNYRFARHDLNGDGRRDALVLFETPYGYWCGMHGCAMLVMKAHNDKFTLINAIQPVREPVYISEMKSNSWKNLVVRISGRWDKAKDVAMLFDGQKYPTNPSNLPPFPKNGNNGYTRVFE